MGKDLIYEGRDTTEEMILEAMDQNGIDACLCYPANSNIGIEAEREKHREVKDFFKRYPERVFGICCVNPHYDEETYFMLKSGIPLRNWFNGWKPVLEQNS